MQKQKHKHIQIHIQKQTQLDTNTKTQIHLYRYSFALTGVLCIKMQLLTNKEVISLYQGISAENERLSSQVKKVTVIVFLLLIHILKSIIIVTGIIVLKSS